MVFGGDYKVMMIYSIQYYFSFLFIFQFHRLSMGMIAAHLTYSCLWCTVSSDKRFQVLHIIVVALTLHFSYILVSRWDMSVDEEYTYVKNGPYTAEYEGVVCSLILNLFSSPGLCAPSSAELDNVVLDELQLLPPHHGCPHKELYPLC